MRIVICDDDKLFLEHFSNNLKLMFKNKGLSPEIICCCSGKEFFIEFNKNLVDVIFLDIKMPDEDGFSIASHLSKLNDKPLIVFTTSIETLVFESFQHEPIWYLLKKNMEQLPYVIDKIIKHISEKQKFFQITISNKLYQFELDDILYFESDNHSIILHTKQNSFRFRGKLNDIGIYLMDMCFIRCHASYLVNCQYIKVIERTKLFLPDNIIIPISRNKLQHTKNMFMNYKGSLRL